jgi:methylglutamate dehydrogenase subunit B
MRINCPYCGERDQAEFSYFGDASKTRPADPMADAATVFDYVYLRENRAGKMDEFWYHGAGCHAWLIVTRHTITHEVLQVRGAREAALGVSA